MAARRRVILTRLAHEQVTDIYQSLLDEGADDTAQVFIDDFLDVGFGDVPTFPDQFPFCPLNHEEVKDRYRMANLEGEFRLIYEIVNDRILILLVIHESELP